MRSPQILTQGDIISDTTAAYNLVINLGWASDWNGDEVGYPDVPVVGLYTWEKLNVYIDIESQSVLEVWSDEFEEDDPHLYIASDSYE